MIVKLGRKESRVVLLMNEKSSTFVFVFGTYFPNTINTLLFIEIIICLSLKNVSIKIIRKRKILFHDTFFSFFFFYTIILLYSNYSNWY